MLTPSELVMLVNYNQRPRMYDGINDKDVANNWAMKLHEHGLIDSSIPMSAVITDKGLAHVKHLCNMPFPVERKIWIIPTLGQEE